MRDKTEMIHYFRQVISSRYGYYGRVAAFGILLSLLARFILDQQELLHSMLNSFILLAILFLGHILVHRRNMLAAMDFHQEDPAGKLQKYLEAGQERWEKGLMLRLITGTVLFLTMLFLMLVVKDNKWMQITSGLFVVFILAIMLKGWMNFSDRILLHDLVRLDRGQDSDKSD